MQSIPRGSRLRVLLPFVKQDEDGTEVAMDLSDIVEPVSVTITKPNGDTITEPELTVTNPSTGEAYWEADEGVLDEPGDWTIRGSADGFISQAARVRVE